MMLNDNEAIYPDVAGHRGVDTSVSAAADINGKLGRLQALVLAAIRSAGAGGLTADEVAERLHMDRWSVQPRTSELRAKRLIADSGQRRTNASAKKAICWVTPEHLPEEERAAA